MPPRSRIRPTPRAPPFAVAFTFRSSGLDEAQLRRVFNSGHATTLKVKSAKSCLGALATGDNAYFAATYHISNPASLIFYSGSRF